MNPSACPLCGSDHMVQTTWSAGLWTVRCDTCHDKPGSFTVTGETEEDVVDEWNERVKEANDG